MTRVKYYSDELTRIGHVVVKKLFNFRQETVFVEQISVGAVLDARVDPTVTNANTLQVEDGIATLSIAFDNTSTLVIVSGKPIYNMKELL